MNYNFPEYLMTAEYIQKQLLVLDKIFCRINNPKNIGDEELKKAMFSAEQIDLIARSILSERGEPILPLGGEMEDRESLLSMRMKDKVLEFIIPPTIKRKGKESWYLATLVKQAMADYVSRNKEIILKHPVIIVCERIIPSEKTIVCDNDSLEMDRIVNECVQHIGFSDHPLKMSYLSITKVKEGERYTKISVMEHQKFLEISENLFKK